MPFGIGQLVDYEPAAVLDSGDFVAAFDRALDEIGWRAKSSLQGREIGGWLHGIGFACFVESGAGGAKEQARIRVAPDGTLDVFVGSASSGQGHETVFTQICADALGLPMDQIRVKCASTDELSEGFGTWHSRSAVMCGNAVRVAAEALVDRLRPLAIDYLGRPNMEIDWIDGGFHEVGAGRCVALPALARFAAGRRELIDITGVFEHSGLKPFSYGANAAHVAVDPGTGQIKVLDFVGVEDIGKVLNPMIAHGQALGAIVQGLGGALLEELVYDEDGQLLTASFADYLLPTASDFPQIRTFFLDLARAPGNLLGAKGGGEGGIVAVAAAIGNAVSAALRPLGVEVRNLPLSPPRVRALVTGVAT